MLVKMRARIGGAFTFTKTRSSNPEALTPSRGMIPGKVVRPKCGSLTKPLVGVQNVLRELPDSTGQSTSRRGPVTRSIGHICGLAAGCDASSTLLAALGNVVAPLPSFAGLNRFDRESMQDRLCGQTFVIASGTSCQAVTDGRIGVDHHEQTSETQLPTVASEEADP